jgi:hypothetical protein
MCARASVRIFWPPQTLISGRRGPCRLAVRPSEEALVDSTRKLLVRAVGRRLTLAVGGTRLGPWRRDGPRRMCGP